MTKKKTKTQIAFGNTVRAKRKQLGISQEELAFRSGLHRTYIADIESGSRNPSLLSIESIANGLNCEMSTLLKIGTN